MKLKLKLQKHEYEGELIVFEGTDGAGKTTLIEQTISYLNPKIGWGRGIVTSKAAD